MKVVVKEEKRPFFKSELFDPDELIIIGLDTSDGPEHPLWDERNEYPLDEALIKNISAFGIIKNVTIVLDGERYLVVDGRRRVRAARELNKRAKKLGANAVRVPARFRKGDEGRLFGVSIAANSLHKSDPPLVSAKKVSRFLDMGRTEKEAAVAFGVTQQTITTWLALLDAPAEARASIESGETSANKVLTELKSGTLSTAMSSKGERKPRTVQASKVKSRALLRKVVKLRPVVLHGEFLRALRWVLGEEEVEFDLNQRKRRKDRVDWTSLIESIRASMDGPESCYEVAKKVGRDQKQVAIALKSMVSAGEVSTVGNGRARQYKLVEDK